MILLDRLSCLLGASVNLDTCANISSMSLFIAMVEILTFCSPIKRTLQSTWFLTIFFSHDISIPSSLEVSLSHFNLPFLKRPQMCTYMQLQMVSYSFGRGPRWPCTS